MTDDRHFSDRYGFRQIEEAEIQVRHDAPYEFRGVLVDLAYECGFGPGSLRELVCRTLRKRPDPSNWSPFPNIDREVRDLIDQSEWYKVYDIVEAIFRKICQRYPDYMERFSKELNLYLVEKGIGWKLECGILEARNPEALEKTIQPAIVALEGTGSKTARTELHEAIMDLSRRPDPDITGAVQHAMASLECVARELARDSKATLGEILKRYPEMAPPPLNASLEKLWGFASEYGRHIREGRNPNFADAQLVVGICAAVVTYLVER